MQAGIKSVILFAVILAPIILCGCGNKNEMTEEHITGFMDQKGVSHKIGNYTIPQKPGSDLPKNWEEAKRRWEEAERREREKTAPAREHARKLLVEPFKQYPKQFPLPQMPRSEVFFAKAPKDWQGRNREKVVILHSKEPPQSIAMFYKNKLQTEGWAIKKETGNMGYYQVFADKPDMEMDITIYARGYDGSMIQIENKQKKAFHK